MAGAGYRLFTAGQVFTAAQVNTYLNEQTVMVFASASARDTALSSVKSEGMRAYLVDVNCLTVYTGSTWSTIGPEHGAGLTWTPTVTQSASVTNTPNTTSYMRLGRKILANFLITMTGSGSANNVITVTLPVTAAVSAGAIGHGYLFDASAVNRLDGAIILNSTTTFKYGSQAVGSNTYLGENPSNFTLSLASSDQLTGFLMYDAAADA